jgi:hypothetical protein
MAPSWPAAGARVIAYVSASPFLSEQLSFTLVVVLNGTPSPTFEHTGAKSRSKVTTAPDVFSPA